MHNFKEKMEERRLGLANPDLAWRVWNVCLTAEERERLVSFEFAYGRWRTVGIYAEAKQISMDRATIEVARYFGLPDIYYQELLMQLPESDLPAVTQRESIPVWHPDLNELKLNGQTIRSVASRANASNVVAILEAFQSAGWPSKIDFPREFRGDVDRQGQIVKSLNRGLQSIKFERDGSGQGIRWRPQG